MATSQSPEQQVPQDTTHGRLAGNIFVGREHELQQLIASMEDVVDGRGRLVLVGGEPGIGKTSIGHELASHARRSGLKVLWGRCDNSSGAPAYWPWVQIVRSFVYDAAPSDVAAAMGAGGADIAEVVPDIREWLLYVPDRPALEPEQARFRLFDSVTTFLRNAAKERPLVVIIDDLHEADTSSLLLLQFLARQIVQARVMVVCLYRDTEVTRGQLLFATLGELTREPVASLLALKGLGEQAIGRYIELSTGRDAPPGLVGVVCRRTDGNPFFIAEIVRLLHEDRILVNPNRVKSWSTAIPEAVRTVIVRRLELLSPECLRVLRVAAVIGREISLDVLEKVSDFSGERLLDVLDEAIGARVLNEVQGWHYSFSHSLVRDTLYDDLTTALRLRLHRRVGDALEALYAARPEPHLGELAHHFSAAAAQGGDIGKAIEYSLLAGEWATGLMAHEEAARHYESCLQLLEASAAPDVRVLDLLLTLTDSLWRAGKIEEAKAASLRAVDLARKLGAGEHLARATLAFAGRLPALGAVESDGKVMTLLEQALEALGADHAALRARLLARLAEELALAESDDHRWALSREAVELARGADDPAVLASVLKCTYFAAWQPAAVEERLVVSNELVQLAERLGDRTLALEAHIFRFLGLVEIADAGAIHKEFDVCDRLATELRQPYHAWILATIRGCMAFMEGRLGDIASLAQQALELGETSWSKLAVLFSGVQSGRLMWLQGRFAEVEPLLMAFRATYPMLAVTVTSALAATYAEQGHERDARAQLEQAVSQGFDRVPRHLAWQATIAFLAEAATRLGDAARAQQLYELLAPLEGRNLLLPPAVTLGPASHYLGLLAVTMGRTSEAARHFEDALGMDAKLGARHSLARTQVAYARLLLESRHPADRARASAMLEEALETARNLGLPRVAERAEELESSADVATSNEAATATSATEEPGAEPAMAAAPGPPRMHGERAVFRREGEYWTIEFRGRVARLKDSKGLRYVAQLLRTPGRQIHALELVVAETRTQHGAMELPAGPPEQTRRYGDGIGELLDATAKAQYKRRLAELREEKEEAERFNDLGRASRAREEISSITQALTSAVGLGGRNRVVGSSAERARWTVTKGIKAAVERIRVDNPALGQHLVTHIRTGHLCCYTPDVDHPVSFVL